MIKQEADVTNCLRGRLLCSYPCLGALETPEIFESSSINRETNLHLLACCLRKPAKHSAGAEEAALQMGLRAVS